MQLSLREITSNFHAQLFQTAVTIRVIKNVSSALVDHIHCRMVTYRSQKNPISLCFRLKKKNNNRNQTKTEFFYARKTKS